MLQPEFQWSKTDGPLVLALIGAGKAGRSLAMAAVRAGLPQLHASVATEDLAIDFVPDELESKLEILSMIDRMAPPKTVICVPTHVLSVNDLASCTYRADRCVGVELGRELLEVTVVAGTRSSAESVAMVEVFWRSVGFQVSARKDAVACP